MQLLRWQALYIGSCHSKKYTENNVSLTSLTLSRLGASHTGQEKIRVRLGWSQSGSSKFVGVASVSFRFVSRFTSTPMWLPELWQYSREFYQAWQLYANRKEQCIPKQRAKYYIDLWRHIVSRIWILRSLGQAGSYVLRTRCYRSHRHS